MVKIYLTSVLFVLFFLNLNTLKAQISIGGTPKSFEKNLVLDNPDLIILPELDFKKIQEEDVFFNDKGTLRRSAVATFVNYNTNNSGTWTTLSDGSKVWQIKIKSPGAKAIAIAYNDFWLPAGTKLFLFNDQKNHVIGAFTDIINPKNGLFSTALIQGEIITLEYYQPAGTTENVRINISSVIHAYRDVQKLVGKYTKDTGWGSSEACEVNVNCPEGANWQDQKKGVAEIWCTEDGTNFGWCSGTLVNNTAQDGTPYFLTADHCGGGAAANLFAQWQFYFNYEATSCTTPGTEPTYNTLTGSTRRSRGDVNGGSDFLLLELATIPPASYNVYYNGWSRSTTPSTSGVCIHHPAGDIKKISVYAASLPTGTFGSCLPNAHWEPTWIQTVTNWGVTEGGSSGSPLFNSGKLVIGTLSGGPSSCTHGSPSDLYGKFHIHWDQNGTTDDLRLKPWLDPSNTNQDSVPGWDPNAVQTVDALFIGAPLTIPVGSTVDFTDQSTGSPTTWNWYFESGTPGTSTQQNPTAITYNTAGIFDVRLIVSDGTTIDTLLKPNYVTVTSSSTLTASFTESSISILMGQTVTFTDQSSGPPNGWNWTFQNGTPATSVTQNQTVTYNTAGDWNVQLVVTNGTETDTLLKTQRIHVVDNSTWPIANFTGNPLALVAGNSVTFTNTSTNNPSNWQWSFPGGTPSSYNGQTPPAIFYNTPGDYNVTLTVSNIAGDNDVETKTNYIHVINPSTTFPSADFVGSPTIMMVGDSANFTDLSGGDPLSWHWRFYGGLPATSTSRNPVNIKYNTSGVYPVRLTVANTLGSDSTRKELYIKVITSAGTQPPIADFTASRRLVTPGTTINFFDESTNNPLSWSWEFPGANITTSTEQNVTGITYSSVGNYTVTLTVSNPNGTDVLTKTEYVIITSNQMWTYCDTISNTDRHIPVWYKDLSDTWGYLPGPNGFNIKAYADRFEDYRFAQINSIIVSPAFSIPANPSTSTIRFKIWSGDALPTTAITYRDVALSSLPFNYATVVTFPTTVLVDGPFFVGYEIKYAIPQDTFLVFIAPDRGPAGPNTLYVLDQQNHWKPCPDVFGVYTSMEIKPYMCLVGVDNMPSKTDEPILYPNPTTDYIVVNYGDSPDFKNTTLQVFDMLGKKIPVKIEEIDGNQNRINFTNQPNGFYFIKIIKGNKTYTKKITVFK